MTRPDDKPTSAAEAERDVEEARADLSGSLDALGSKLKPDALLAEAKAYFTDDDERFTDVLIREARANPVAALMAGAGIAWLLIGARSRAEDRRRYAAARASYEPPSEPDPMAGTQHHPRPSPLMLSTPSIQELPAPRPRLYAFRITGTVTQDDMAAMGERMVEVFEASDAKVDMLLVFEDYAGSEALAGFSWPAIKSRTQALWSVDRYAVAGAPEAAAEMIEAMDQVMPVQAETYSTEAEAWTALGTQPARV
jgi:hypothetical protein